VGKDTCITTVYNSIGTRKEIGAMEGFQKKKIWARSTKEQKRGQKRSTPQAGVSTQKENLGKTMLKILAKKNVLGLING